jgi:plastocyanin
MTQQVKRGVAGGTVLAVGAALFVASLALSRSLSSAPGEVTREVVLEARELAFGGNNPTLRFRPGERVRFVVRNSDTGVLHSITLPGIDPEVRHVRWGEALAFEVTMPQPGTWEYVCPQHLPKMKGRIEVGP